MRTCKVQGKDSYGHILVSFLKLNGVPPKPSKIYEDASTERWLDGLRMIDRVLFKMVADMLRGKMRGVIYSVFLGISISSAYGRHSGMDDTSSLAGKPAEEAGAIDANHQHRLLADWMGNKSWLSSYGLDLEMVYKGDFAWLLNKKNERKTEYLANIDIKALLDLEKTIGWSGASALFYLLWNRESHLSDRVGDLQGTSNIETNTTTSKLYVAWLQQNFYEDKISILAGLYDLNSEFYVTNSSGVFLNASFGIGNELAQTGVNGPSIFPNTALAARLLVKPVETFYMQSAVFNAQAGDPERPRGTHFPLNKDHGLLLVSEFGYSAIPEAHGPMKIGFGFWTYTRTFDHLSKSTFSESGLEEPDTATQRTNSGYYVLIDHLHTDDISSFVRYGAADSRVNQISESSTAGMLFHGLLPGRTDDSLGIGIAYVKNGRYFKELMDSNSIDVRSTEIAYELSYRFVVLPGFIIQPDYQFIQDTGTDPEIGHTSLGMIRVEVSL